LTTQVYRIGARQGGVLKIDQKEQLLFCPKRDLTGKKAILMGIFLNVPQIFEFLLHMSLDTVKRRILNTIFFPQHEVLFIF